MAAIEAARAGRRVTLFEKAREMGGRARTTDAGEYRLDLKFSPVWHVATDERASNVNLSMLRLTRRY